jgi:hypothetical protein
MGEGSYAHRCTHGGGAPRPHLIVQCGTFTPVLSAKSYLVYLPWSKLLGNGVNVVCEHISILSSRLGGRSI